MKTTQQVFLFILLIVSVCNAQSDRFEKVKVSDNIYAFITPDPTRDLVDGNSIAIITEEGVLVFDANATPSTARAVLNEIKKITDKPVRYVVNSHWHFDHLTGNFVYKEAFPGLQVIAHAYTRKIITPRFDNYVNVVMQSYAATRDTFTVEIRRGTTSSGEKLTDYEKIRREQAVKDLDIYVNDFKQGAVKLVAPSITFDQSLTLYMGGKEIRIMHYYNGNTPGDVFIYLPQDKILITGDLLVNPVPYTFNSYPTNWINTLIRMTTLDAKVIIPGHGAVQHSNEYLLLVIEAMKEAVEEVRNGIAERLTLDQIRIKVTLESFRERFTKNDVAKEWAFKNYFVSPLLERIYKEMRGEIGGEQAEVN